MQDHEAKQWRRALHLYEQGLLDAVDDSPAEQTPDAEPEAVQDKLKQLLNTCRSETGDPLNDRLDTWIINLGLSSEADVASAEAAMIGRQLGDWTIKSKLGRGGMASVYLVERSGVEFQQNGALKLLSLLSLASDGLKRFIREQQFLAQLQHPNIAMLLDGGVAQDGTPYLVMELVEGLPITGYCAQHSLKGEAITNLILQVCDAVGHAHSKLILHRDIKPSNVMVTAGGQIKLLDFGIGKLNDETADATLSRVYTPKYAAPEQRHGNAVTTATDVFGVGTLAQTLLNECPDKYLDSHREIASVLAKATHEEPERRYSSTESLARDLRNCLENRPISAVPDSHGYRVRKFARRNRGMVAAGVAMVAIAAVGLVAVLWQADAARQEAHKANALSEFMIDLFADGDLFSGQGPDTPISTLMQEGAQRARTQLQATPDARSEVLRVIGLAQTEFGDYEQAGANIQAAMDSAESRLERAKVLGSLGVWYAERAEYTEGIVKLNEALEIMSEELPASNPDRLEVATDLINFLLFIGEEQQSLERVDALIADIGSLDSLPDLDHANVLRSRAMALTQLGRFDEAIEQLGKALQLADTLEPSRQALVAAYQNDIGIAYYYKGDMPASVDAIFDSYDTQVSIYGADHKRTITSGTNLVIMLRSAGQYQRGIDLGESLLANSLNTFGEVSRSTTLSRFALALVLSDAGRHLEADEQLAASTESLRQLPELRFELPNHLSWRGEILIRLARFEQAITVLDEAEFIRDTEFPEEARRYRVAAQQRLVQAHAALKECESADSLLANIRADLLDGNPDQWLATRIYMLNCSKDGAAATSVYAEARQTTAEREDMAADLRAALQWSQGRFL